jgi:hypothetical protein
MDGRPVFFPGIPLEEPQEKRGKREKKRGI